MDYVDCESRAARDNKYALYERIAGIAARDRFVETVIAQAFCNDGIAEISRARRSIRRVFTTRRGTLRWNYFKAKFRAASERIDAWYAARWHFHSNYMSRCS